MASTNKTENLGLSQWEASDAFTREDLNADFQILDKSLGTGLVKLIDLALTESKSSVLLDLRECDLSKFTELQIYFPKEGKLRVNSFSGNFQYYNSNGNWQDCGSQCESPAGFISVRNVNGLASTLGDIHLSGVRHYYAPADSVGVVRFFYVSNSTAFPVGTRFLVLGVRP